LREECRPVLSRIVKWLFARWIIYWTYNRASRWDARRKACPTSAILLRGDEVIE
jgi:hypothetical protein